MHMKLLSDELSAVLRTAEESVLDIVARAAAERDYAMIDKARSLAERLRALEKAEQSQLTNARAEPAKKQRRMAGKRKARESSDDNYPKFKVANDSLYKIGWSKKKGAEYTHRVPLERARKIIGVLDQLSQKVSGVISTEKILGSDELQTASIPSYQTYNVLALLKREKIIVSAGRDGYQLPTGIFRQADSLLCKLEGESDDS